MTSSEAVGGSAAGADGRADQVIEPAALGVEGGLGAKACIEGGTGRVRVGDGEWPAEGPDLAAGAKARIASVRGGVVVVEAVKAIEG
mgnify:CR=1 FL=1